MRWFAEWLVGCIVRFLTFFVLVVTTCMCVSWLFGTDDAVKRWATDNRGLTATVIILTIVLFVAYDSLQERDR